MKKFSKVLSLLVMASIAMAAPALAKERIVFGGGPAGGTFQTVANAIQVFEPVKAMDFTVKAQSSAGSVENLRKVDYGTHKDEYLLLAQHSPEAPLLVFIHGGYWKALSADECCMWASDALAQGISFASINYTLAPQANLSHIVQQCRLAVQWLQQHSALTPCSTVVSGSSAGAHLAAMCSTADLNNNFITNWTTLQRASCYSSSRVPTILINKFNNLGTTRTTKTE